MSLTQCRQAMFVGAAIMFSECAGIARDFAKVVDQVRFLARALTDRLQTRITS